ncbi:MAG TPA: phosphotransferase [Actinomycetes bacterium]|nr:phosphotransferase [Actinomycetes bacterium]
MPLPTLEELLATAVDREPMVDTAGKSGALLERVRIDGTAYVLKHLDRTRDWTLRSAGVLDGVTPTLWDRGLLGALPDCFEQPIVAVARTPVGASVLMRDVGQWLFPVSDEPISLEQHLRVLDHMARMHAAFWDAGPEIDVVPVMHRYLDLSPWTAEAEEWLGDPPLVPRLVGIGWPRLGEVAPAAYRVVGPLARDPGLLVEALADTPQTFVHGNVKLDNLGVTPEGRTVLLDWELSGRGAPASDLAWYLAINCRRLPQSKEAAIGAYREALERHGVDTDEWWERQVALCLLGALVQFGWEKALGGYDAELAWWEARALAAAHLL